MWYLNTHGSLVYNDDHCTSFDLYEGHGYCDYWEPVAAGMAILENQPYQMVWNSSRSQLCVYISRLPFLPYIPLLSWAFATISKGKSLASATSVAPFCQGQQENRSSTEIKGFVLEESKVWCRGLWCAWKSGPCQISVVIFVMKGGCEWWPLSVLNM